MIKLFRFQKKVLELNLYGEIIIQTEHVQQNTLCVKKKIIHARTTLN